MRAERKCVKCGKNFIPAPYHVYTENELCYCSWTCFNHRHDDEQPFKQSRPVKQYDRDGHFLRIYATAAQAAEILHGTANNIRQACRNSTRYKGYYWKYGEC